jgi:hypothetical protein
MTVSIEPARLQVGALKHPLLFTLGGEAVELALKPGAGGAATVEIPARQAAAAAVVLRP